VVSGLVKARAFFTTEFASVPQLYYKRAVHTKNIPPSPDLALDHQLYYPWGSFSVSEQGRVSYPEMAPLQAGPYSINPLNPDADLPHPPLDIVLVAPHEYTLGRDQLVKQVQGRWKMLVTAQEHGESDFEKVFPGVRDPDADIVHGMCYGLASGLGQALVQFAEERQFKYLKNQQRVLTGASYGSAGVLMVGDLIPDMTVSPYALAGAAAIIGTFEVLRRRQLSRDIDRITGMRPHLEEMSQKSSAIVATMVHESYHGPVPPIEFADEPYVTV
jgi:hypothetical protein